MPLDPTASPLSVSLLILDTPTENYELQRGEQMAARWKNDLPTDFGALVAGQPLHAGSQL